MYLKSFSSLDIRLYLTEEWNKKKSSDLVVNPFLDHLVLGLAKHKLVFFFFFLCDLGTIVSIFIFFPNYFY